MPLFMDMHTIEGGVSVADVASAHKADLGTQAKYGVSYLRYWVDEEAGKTFCLVEADDAEAANTVHRKHTDWSRTRSIPSASTAEKIGILWIQTAEHETHVRTRNIHRQTDGSVPIARRSLLPRDESRTDSPTRQLQDQG